MSYVKYREDDEKILEHRRFLRSGSESLSHSLNPVQYFDCKYCHAVFTDRNLLFLHIKKAHNIVRPLVVINGKIASDHCIVHYIDSAHIILFGYNDGIMLNGESILFDNDIDEIDITSKLSRELGKVPRCVINFQEASIEIEMLDFSVENEEIIEEAVSQWEKEVNQGIRLSTAYLNQPEEGNRLFLHGVYNYYLACRAKKDKSKRYDDAWSILSRFNDLHGIGNCILRVIAYRRNWISSLNRLSTGGIDDLTIANDYYQQRKSDWPDSAPDKQLYIEDSTRFSLELVLLFQKNEFSAVRTRLSELPDLDDIDNLNLVDQLNLVSARLAIIDGNKEKAASYYEKLVAPCFQEEYTLFKKGQVHFGD